MKYIKSYYIKESESHYYTKLSFVDWDTNRSSIDFTDDEAALIESGFDSSSLLIVREEFYIHIYFCGKGIRKEKRFGLSWITIQKFEDEWYYVSVNNLFNLSKNGVTDYYQCDQFEGLLQLIKDKRTDTDAVKYLNEMKVIKLYEEYIKSYYIKEGVEYYYEITPSESDRLSRKTPPHKYSFSGRELESLNRLDRFGDYAFGIEDDCITFMLVDNDFNEIVGDIYKLGEDEWYLVQVNPVDHDTSVNRLRTQYYKCDQIDGLVDLLMSLKNGFPDSTLTINDI